MVRAAKETPKVNYAKELVRLQGEYYGVILARGKPGYPAHLEPADTDLSYMSRISSLLENMPEPATLEDLQAYFGSVEVPLFSGIARVFRRTYPRHEVIEEIFGMPAERTKALVKALEDVAMPRYHLDLNDSPLSVPRPYFVSEEQKTAQLAQWQEAEERAVALGREMLDMHRHAAYTIRDSLHSAYYSSGEPQRPSLKRTEATA